ncbi:hypothetical protein QJS10_CPB21g01024 [Acorus calamus]|uniref:Uncharacterized protein n=1 Tax=Acorus calamus TaxID=4465 RepID=A0AAV9C4T1_ACOCL|nr:hypothetical protein QJS10_CPB21g01024 [Acorus calamus]
MNVGGLDIFVLDDEPINMKATILDQDWTCINGIIEVIPNPHSVGSDDGCSDETCEAHEIRISLMSTPTRTSRRATKNETVNPDSLVDKDLEVDEGDNSSEHRITIDGESLPKAGNNQEQAPPNEQKGQAQGYKTRTNKQRIKKE